MNKDNLGFLKCWTCQGDWLKKWCKDCLSIVLAQPLIPIEQTKSLYNHRSFFLKQSLGSVAVVKPPESSIPSNPLPIWETDGRCHLDRPRSNTAVKPFVPSGRPKERTCLLASRSGTLAAVTTTARLPKVSTAVWRFGSAGAWRLCQTRPSDEPSLQWQLLKPGFWRMARPGQIKKSSPQCLHRGGDRGHYSLSDVGNTG